MKHFLTIILLFFMVSANSLATNADLFSIDEIAMEAQLSELTELESLVTSSPDLTFDEVASTLDFELEAHSYALMASKFTLDDMEWGPFLWGFLCCPVGLFVVVLDDSSTKNEKLSYWIGVGANVVLSGITNGIVFAVR